MKKISVILVFYLISYLSAGVLSSIKGDVQNAKEKIKIEKVKITIESFKIKNMKYVVYTDKKGFFYKTGLQPGMYSITYEKGGFLPKKRVVRIGISENINVSIKLDPVDSSNNIPEGKMKTAINDLNKGKYKESLKLFFALAKKNPQNPVYYFYMGLNYEKINNINEAIKSYERSLEIKEDFAFSLRKLGTLYAKKGNYNKAVKYYKAVIAQGEIDAEIYYNFGVCYINLGKNKEAKDAMEQVIKLDSDYSEAYYQLGLIYLGLGDMKKTKEMLNGFIKISSNKKNVETAKSILKSLK
jgi:tetratricopeptide (TPR) repeat protein